RGRAAWAGRLLGARCAGSAQTRAVHRTQVFFLGVAPDGTMLVGERIDIDLAELARQVVQRTPQLVFLERSDDQMAGTDLRLAEEQRRVIPAGVEHLLDLVGNLRHLGLALAQRA